MRNIRTLLAAWVAAFLMLGGLLGAWAVGIRERGTRPGSRPIRAGQRGRTTMTTMTTTEGHRSAASTPAVGGWRTDAAAQPAHPGGRRAARRVPRGRLGDDGDR